MTKRVIIYARVSSFEQSQKYGLETQLELCRDFVRNQGWNVVAEYTDAITGTKLERQGLDLLRRDIADGKANAVVVAHVDRLNRDYVHQMLLVRELKSYGAEVYYASRGGRAVGGTPQDEFIDGIEALISQYERDRIISRTSEGRRQKARQGKLAGTGNPPYGYRRTGNDGDYTLEVVEEEAQVVRSIFRWYIEGVSIRVIRERLRGIPTPGELRQFRTRKRAPGVWNTPAIYLILHREIYTGVGYQYKTIVRKKDGKREVQRADKSHWLPFYCPPIIDEETYKIAQKRLAEGRTNASRNRRYFYLLARRIRCYSCKTACAGQPAYNGRYTYYSCNRTRDKLSYDSLCQSAYIPTGPLDAYIWEWVSEQLLSPDVLEQRKDAALEESQGVRAQIQQSRSALREEQSRLEQERVRLVRLYTRGSIDEVLFESEKGLIDRRGDEIQKELQRLDETEAALATPEQFATTEALIEELRPAAEQATEEQKTQILDLLDIRVEAQCNPAQREIFGSVLSLVLGVADTFRIAY